MSVYRKIVAYFEVIRFRKAMVHKILFGTTSEDDVKNVLDSLNYSDRRWVIERVRISLAIKDQNEMQRELKEYNSSVPKWKRKLEMLEFERILYSTH